MINLNEQSTERFYFLSYHLPDEADRRETTANLGPLDEVCFEVYRDALESKGIHPFILSGSFCEVEKIIKTEKELMENI